MPNIEETAHHLAKIIGNYHADETVVTRLGLL